MPKDLLLHYFVTLQYVYVAIWGKVYMYFNYTKNYTVKVLCECTVPTIYLIFN